MELYALYDRPLSDDERTRLREGVRRRAAGEPLQYVTGEMPFRHLVVEVRPGVLIPRPETEVLVDEALRAVDAAIGARGSACVVDACTGSGCVALSIAQERPDVRVWATDLAADAVALSLDNAERLQLADRVNVLAGDLLDPLPPELAGAVDVVVANPPYVPTADVPRLPAEVLGYEPRLALDGGADGLDVARRLWTQATRWLRVGGVIALELDARMVSLAAEEVIEWYEDVQTVQDLTGRDRILVAKVRNEGSA